MAMTLNTLVVPLRRLWRDPRWPLLVLGVLAISWAGWTGWHAMIEKPLASTAIQSQRLRINTAQQKALTDNIAQYHRPTTPTPVLADPLANPAPTSTNAPLTNQ